MARSSEKCGRAEVVRCWNNSIIASLAVQSISQERINQNRTNTTLTDSVSAAGRGRKHCNAGQMVRPRQQSDTRTKDQLNLIVMSSGSGTMNAVHGEGKGVQSSRDHSRVPVLNYSLRTENG